MKFQGGYEPLAKAYKIVHRVRFSGVCCLLLIKLPGNLICAEDSSAK